jgi:hypothetical protein
MSDCKSDLDSWSLLGNILLRHVLDGRHAPCFLFDYYRGVPMHMVRL